MSLIIHLTGISPKTVSTRSSSVAKDPGFEIGCETHSMMYLTLNALLFPMTIGSNQGEPPAIMTAGGIIASGT
jgi:hypothetical protein